MMNKERVEKLEKLMENVFEAISEFEETVKKSDMKWAQKYKGGELEDFASSLLNYGENLSDNGKNFNYNFE
jgi:hypothetical protein